MAIEIEPERKETYIFQKILALAAGLFLIFSIAAYFYLNNYLLPQKNAELSRARSSLSSLTDSTMDTKEAEIKQAQQYISDFKILYNNNPKVSKFFTSFEVWANPNITYSSFSLDVDNKKVSLHGNANGFQNIMQQIASIQNESTVSSYNMSNVQMSGTGPVTFDLEVVLKPSVFQ